MTNAKKKWSYSTGERGRNRVRAFEHPDTGRIFLEFTDTGKRKRIALGHRDRKQATAKAEEVAAALRKALAPIAPAPTLRTLFDNYIREVTPRKGQSKQRHDRRAAEMFLEFFGANRKAATLNRRDWDAFIEWRKHGGVGGRTVRDRVITYDLKFLHSVLNWATTVGDGRGGVLLERNPLRGMAWPREQSPMRPMLTAVQYKRLLLVSRRVSEMFKLALVLAHESGHRIGSIRLIRWSDADFTRGVIRWRAENDKIGFEHETVLTPVAKQALLRARRARKSIGDTWIFPAPGNPSEPCSRHLFRDWWKRAEALAELQPERGRGWHSLRRKFATEMKHTPLKDLCYLGGWKDPQTVLKCYQRPDETTMREALAHRRPLEAGEA
jgi:integrase